MLYHAAMRHPSIWLVTVLGTVLGTALVACDAVEIPGPQDVEEREPAPVRGDILIRGGVVIDGTGAPGRRADVLIAGDRIVRIGAIDGERVAARHTIDASGKVVTPGFVDAHAHGDPRRTPEFKNFTAMGVTTICLGQDGSSPGGSDLRAWLRTVERGRFAPNLATLVGHGTVRRLAGISMDRDPTREQLDRMVQLIEAAMAAGAFGLSTGLEYEPGRFAGAEELRRIAEPVAAHGGLVMSHIRSEDDDAIDRAVDELLVQCAAAGCAAHISHLKIVYGHGTERADRLLSSLASARAAGHRITADVYPYLASYTGIGIVFPHWARPPNDYAKVVAGRREELSSYLRRRVTARNGPEATILGTGPWRGRTLAAIASELDKPFEDVLIDDLGPRGASAAYFVMAAEVMERLLVDRHVMVSSDGSPTMRHPRGHGAFARMIREYVVERRLLTLEKAVHKMTGLTADTLGLERRGLLRKGYAADVLVFDPAQVRDRATFVMPFRRAEGFDTVLVNGEFVRRDGTFTANRPGRILRRPGSSPR